LPFLVFLTKKHSEEIVSPRVSVDEFVFQQKVDGGIVDITTVTVDVAISCFSHQKNIQWNCFTKIFWISICFLQSAADGQRRRKLMVSPTHALFRHGQRRHPRRRQLA
jgi:hypothetical protein